ncbi:hypothetical protein EZV73_03235 [Acidaminobacter sp. JC074]|uniref:hypothetical protein n=1 Tax=Acidaminobacter sp. JC074 TaxID=2530199 RepID=UPI001F0FCC95|nr:hypothetical protein [Acidaminobacter sp. JC074]MCH4886563.1 hypothetical protein [Acidaminobacter sp. JC074]
MKKWLVLLMVVMMVMSAVGCGASSANDSVLKLEEDNGILTCLDTETSPLDGGLLITVDKENKTVNMQITDAEGNPTVEFYNFNVEENICHRYKYVSMMGTGFNYMYDYNKEELVQILDNDDVDKTQSTKDSGRFDGAQSETKENVDALKAYFETAFGMKIEDSIL